MTRELVVRPRGPYSLALSAARATDATRWFVDGVLTALISVEGRPEIVRASQDPSGAVTLRGASAVAIERARFCLALDDDHSEFLRRFRRDPLIGNATVRMQGLRPPRVPTVALALLRALCGQLIDARRARAIEARIVREAACAQGRGLCEAPTARSLGRFAPAELRALGLHARRGATLVRLCGSVRLEELTEQPTPVVAMRLARERGIGPWSIGTICLEGLGRWDYGLVGDLGLVKLCSALHGRFAQPEETLELLAPYGEWAGLASNYLLSAFGHGLIPLPGARPRRPSAHLRPTFAT